MTTKPDYIRHLQSEIQGDTKIIYYDIKPNKDYLIMHDEDIAYIHHWLTRFVVDVTAKQFLAPDLYNAGIVKTIELGTSNYNNETNSILSYASGIVGNRLRNPSQDYTKPQLVPLQKLFNTIYYAYDTVFTKQDLGYDLKTDIDNDKPYRIKFKLLGSK
tara:strand:+ start:344 stop:820 length:477 start_codon:yes stop_codon:yes gene_type:complete